MSEIYIENPRYRLVLEKDELRLVGLALAGMLKDKGKDCEAARELNKRILAQLGMRFDEQRNLIEGALKKAGLHETEG